MANYFSAENVEKLNRGREDVHGQYENLLQRYISRKFKSDRAREHATQGFCRRLGTLVRAIDQVYDLLPPEREDIPEREEVVDATIAIQSFVLNTFGCLDNLAWIWVCEKDVKADDETELDPRRVGFGTGNREVRRSLSKEFRAYLDTRQEWVDHVKGFRDSLAHRIPLYIPPFIVTPETMDEYNRLEQLSIEAMQRRDFKEYDRLQSEQKKCGLFRPWMTHSQYEKAPTAIFHQQLLQDYVTVDEFGRKMLEELDQ